MVTRLRVGRLENRGSIPDRKDDLSRFYSREPCIGSGQAVYVILWGTKWQWDRLFSSTSIFPVNIIPPTLHSHLHLHAALPEGQTGEVWETCRKSEGMKQNGTFTEMSEDLRRWRNARRAFP